MPTLQDMLRKIDGLRDEIVRLEQDLVRIPSVNTGFMPTGNETAVAEYIRDFLAKDGIVSEMLESAPGRGSVIARLEGESSDAHLMFMSHLDVVPIEDESKWTYPPFSATVANGRVYGRGASDCKSLLTSQLMAMRVLKQSGVPLKHSLILASGADEEHGGRYGFGWLAEKHPEKITARFAVNEGGGVPADAAGTLAFVVNLGEKGRLQVEIEIKGTSAHASIPWTGTNALYSLAQVIQRIESYEAERDTSHEIFRHLSTFGIEHVASPENIDEVLVEVERKNPRLALTLKAASRMTLTPTMVNGGIKSNSVPETIRLTCDVRTLPHQDDEYLKGELEKLIGDIPGVDFSIDYMAVPNSSPAESELMDHVKRATNEVLGRDDILYIPGLCVGFTDSRFTRPLGVVTYGYSGVHPEDDPYGNNIHGTNEFESIRTLVNSTKVMLALAYNICVE